MVRKLRTAGSPQRRRALPKTKAGAPKRGRVGQAQEEAILRAAEAVFAERGFSGATTAAIAKQAGLPKPNVHYYFRTKEALYRAVLRRILQLWLSATDTITEDADPATALRGYIAEKMRYTQRYPLASKVFANELLHGAPEIGNVLRQALRELVARKAMVIRAWIEGGQMAPVDPYHLFFTIWAATQTYADFEAQVCAVLGVSQLDADDFEHATEHLVALLLRGCGLQAPDSDPERA